MGQKLGNITIGWLRGASAFPESDTSPQAFECHLSGQIGLLGKNPGPLGPGLFVCRFTSPEQNSAGDPVWLTGTPGANDCV